MSPFRPRSSSGRSTSSLPPDREFIQGLQTGARHAAQPPGFMPLAQSSRCRGFRGGAPETDQRFASDCAVVVTGVSQEPGTKPLRSEFRLQAGLRVLRRSRLLSHNPRISEPGRTVLTGLKAELQTAKLPTGPPISLMPDPRRRAFASGRSVYGTKRAHGPGEPRRGRPPCLPSRSPRATTGGCPYSHSRFHPHSNAPLLLEDLPRHRQSEAGGLWWDFRPGCGIMATRASRNIGVPQIQMILV